MTDFLVSIYESCDLTDDQKEYLLAVAEDMYVEAPDVEVIDADVIDPNTPEGRRLELEKRISQNNNKYIKQANRAGMVKKVAGAAYVGSAGASMVSDIALRKSAKELERLSDQIGKRKKALQQTRNPDQLKRYKGELADLEKIHAAELKKYQKLSAISKASKAGAFASAVTGFGAHKYTRNAAIARKRNNIDALHSIDR